MESNGIGKGIDQLIRVSYSQLFPLPPSSSHNSSATSELYKTTPPRRVLCWFKNCCHGEKVRVSWCTEKRLPRSAGCFHSQVSCTDSQVSSACLRTQHGESYAWTWTSVLPLLCHVASKTPQFPQWWATSLVLFIMYGTKQRQRVKQNAPRAQALGDC
jgi:hypothetical protein